MLRCGKTSYYIINLAAYFSLRACTQINGNMVKFYAFLVSLSKVRLTNETFMLLADPKMLQTCMKRKHIDCNLWLVMRGNSHLPLHMGFEPQPKGGVYEEEIITESIVDFQ